MRNGKLSAEIIQVEGAWAYRIYSSAGELVLQSGPLVRRQDAQEAVKNLIQGIEKAVKQKKGAEV